MDNQQSSSQTKIMQQSARSLMTWYILDHWNAEGKNCVLVRRVKTTRN